MTQVRKVGRYKRRKISINTSMESPKEVTKKAVPKTKAKKAETKTAKK